MDSSASITPADVFQSTEIVSDELVTSEYDITHPESADIAHPESEGRRCFCLHSVIEKVARVFKENLSKICVASFIISGIALTTIGALAMVGLITLPFNPLAYMVPLTIGALLIAGCILYLTTLLVGRPTSPNINEPNTSVEEEQETSQTGVPTLPTQHTLYAASYVSEGEF